MRTPRSWMFVPGHRRPMIEKALGLALDVAIFDREDAVPPAEKETARRETAAALACPAGGPRRFVRVQPPRSPELEGDLEAVRRTGLAGLVLPKVGGPEDVARVEALLTPREDAAGLSSGTLALVALIETARGLAHAPAIAAASPRLVALMLGAEDLALDLGRFAALEQDDPLLQYARAAVAVAAASARLQAIDRVYLEVRDREGLRRDTLQARRLGFSGKALIHPTQIDVVHAAFRPMPGEIAAARRIVERFESAVAAGQGAVLVDGRMVDRPVFERARRLLDEQPVESTP